MTERKTRSDPEVEVRQTSLIWPNMPSLRLIKQMNKQMWVNEQILNQQILNKQIDALSRQLLLDERQKEELEDKRRLYYKEQKELRKVLFEGMPIPGEAQGAHTHTLHVVIASLRLLDSLARLIVNRANDLYLRMVGKGARSTDRQSLVVHPPGMSMLKLARVIYSDKYAKEQFEPAVADWHSEYFDALESNASRPKMFFVRLRNTWAILKLFGIVSWLGVIGKFITRMFSQK